MSHLDTYGGWGRGIAHQSRAKIFRLGAPLQNNTICATKSGQSMFFVSRINRIFQSLPPPTLHPPSIMSPPDNNRQGSVVLATQNSESEHLTQNTSTHLATHVVDLLFNGVVFYVNPFLGVPRIAQVPDQFPPKLARTLKRPKNTCFLCIPTPCLCLRSLTYRYHFSLDLIVGRATIQTWSTQDTAL